MNAAAMFGGIGGEGPDGPDRARALQRSFEYVEDKLLDVDAVQCVDAMRNGDTYKYYVARF